MKRRYVRWAIIAAAALLVIVVLRLTLFRQRPIEVEAATVGRGLVEDAVTNSQAGTVKARRRARVGADRAGVVVAIPHREGAAVRRGVTLLQLDPSSAQHQLDLSRRDRDALRAAVEAARAAAVLARRDFERIEQLFARNVVSAGEMDLARSKRDSAEAELKAAQARLARAEASVRLAQDELGHLRVTAPFDGVVSERLVEVGESLIPGQPVLEVTSLADLYVSAPIDEIDIGRLSTGLPARVTLDPHPGVTWSGVVSRVSAVVNDVREQNRTLEVEVEIKGQPGLPLPKPGSSADVQIIIDRHDSVLRVPTFAVIEGRRVLVVKDGKAASREVAAGLKNWEWTEVTSGLAEGDRVITNLDRQGLKAGVAVTIKPASEKGAAGTAQAKGTNGSGK